MNDARHHAGTALFGIPRTVWVALALLALTALPALSQQTYVTRFDAYAGFGYLNSPLIGLAENGVHLQGGVRVARWLSLGVDYTRATGDVTLTPNLLVPAEQQVLNAQIAGLIAAKLLPSTYALAVPAHSTTTSITGGPQFSCRHWKPITLFIRPDLGAMLEDAAPHPVAGDSFAAAVAASLAPSGVKHDRVMYYGFGGGIDFNLTNHFALRVQADLVHDHLFDDLLKDSRNTVRFSIGPAFNFGSNIAKYRPRESGGASNPAWPDEGPVSSLDRQLHSRRALLRSSGKANFRIGADIVRQDQIDLIEAGPSGRQSSIEYLRRIQLFAIEVNLKTLDRFQNSCVRGNLGGLRGERAGPAKPGGVENHDAAGRRGRTRRDRRVLRP
jgi:hypothetical protein